MSDTMAEAFCEEYLITWTEHGEDFTGWLHRDIFTRSNRMSRAGAISLFHPWRASTYFSVSLRLVGRCERLDGECGLDHFAGCVRPFRGPVPEARPEPMRHGGDAEFLGQFR